MQGWNEKMVKGYVGFRGTLHTISKNNKREATESEPNSISIKRSTV